MLACGGQRRVIEAAGAGAFPELDRLYIPRVAQPAGWDDYTQELVPGAEAGLLELLCASDEMHAELSAIISRARWKFSWTYARTYPHEYTTQALCPAADHAALIARIEEHGIVERFGQARRKYLYFGERKYWHMGDPASDDPAQRPNVINRTWVDVRRHAENVRHRWTEEVQLQMRLWEIQLEKSTDCAKG